MWQSAMLIVVATLGAERAPTETEILDGTEARIREHRTSEAVVTVRDASGQPLPPGTSVEIEQTRHTFLFGCNIFALGRLRTPEDNAAYAKRFDELLNFATLPFYWWSYERAKGKPDYANTERILAWCRKHDVTTKGHPLAWNYVDPPWVPEDPARLMDLQVARIGTCAKRFRDQIMIWDVVNEAAHYDREHVRKQAPRLTRAIDTAGVGEYIRRAFRAARAASPEATLLINDYRLDTQYEKRVLAELVDKAGQPLYDVIGLQSHQHGGAKSVTELWATCERFAKYGKPLHWTENTFVSGEQGWNLKKNRQGRPWVTTPEGETRQAKDVARFYTLLFSHPAVEAITWWDFCDQNAWQGAPAGLLRADLSPKPAYERLHDLIRKAWWTRAREKVGAEGTATFRGFHGTYRITATCDGRRLTGTFTLDRKGARAIRVKLVPSATPLR